MDEAGGQRIYTIGHSNHSAEIFLALLRRHEVAVLVDVRSQPYSKYTPHFSGERLKDWVQAAGLRYLFLGRELGGRPDGAAFYDAEGHARYDLVAQTTPFRDAIDRLIRGSEQYRVALLCAEEDPTGCHRRLLVGSVLTERGLAVLHIRADESVISEQELCAKEERERAGQLSLFDAVEAPAWRSLHAIRPPRAWEG